MSLGIPRSRFVPENRDKPPGGAGQEAQEGAPVFQGTCEGRIVRGREGAVQDVPFPALRARGALFLTPKPSCCSCRAGSALPRGMSPHPSATLGAVGARFGAVPSSPSPPSWASRFSPAEVTAGPGAAGGRALETRRFLPCERLPKANNRRRHRLSPPLPIPGAGSGCSRTNGAADPESRAGGARSPRFQVPPGCFWLQNSRCLSLPVPSKLRQQAQSERFGYKEVTPGVSPHQPGGFGMSRDTAGTEAARSEALGRDTLPGTPRGPFSSSRGEILPGVKSSPPSLPQVVLKGDARRLNVHGVSGATSGSGWSWD